MNIHAGRISRAATGQDLKDAFTAFGKVSSASIIKGKLSGEDRHGSAQARVQDHL